MFENGSPYVQMCNKENFSKTCLKVGFLPELRPPAAPCPWGLRRAPSGRHAPTQATSPCATGPAQVGASFACDKREINYENGNDSGKGGKLSFSFYFFARFRKERGRRRFRFQGD